MNAWSLVTEFHVLNIQDFLDATDQIVDPLETIQMASVRI
jgi:hypothetical protein